MNKEQAIELFEGLKREAKQTRDAWGIGEPGYYMSDALIPAYSLAISILKVLDVDEESKAELKYIVELPIHYWNDEMSKLEENFAYLIQDITTDETQLSATSNETEIWRSKFTEQEIKSIDERYWPFAVPVEEDQK